MKNGAISAKSLTKNYGEFCAVNNVSLEIPKGICFGLLGPNGAGKTTMIQMIQASSPITNGKLEVLGMDTISDSREIRKKIAARAKILSKKYSWEKCSDDTFSNLIKILKHLKNIA